MDQKWTPKAIGILASVVRVIEIGASLLYLLMGFSALVCGDRNIR